MSGYSHANTWVGLNEKHGTGPLEAAFLGLVQTWHKTTEAHAEACHISHSVWKSLSAYITFKFQSYFAHHLTTFLYRRSGSPRTKEIAQYQAHVAARKRKQWCSKRAAPTHPTVLYKLSDGNWGRWVNLEVMCWNWCVILERCRYPYAENLRADGIVYYSQPHMGVKGLLQQLWVQTTDLLSKGWSHVPYCVRYPCEHAKTQT